MTNVNTVIAVVAIVISLISVGIAVQEPDTSGFVNQSQHRAMGDRIIELENAKPNDYCVNDAHCMEALKDTFVTNKNALKDAKWVTEQFEKFQAEIVKTKDKINDNHPFDFEPEELVDPSVEGEQITPTVEGVAHQLTIHLERSEWLRGEHVIITGDARIGEGQVEAVIEPPKGDTRYLNAIVKGTGEYQFNFGTDFDSPLGEYLIHVEQRNKISETVMFTLGE